MPKVDFFKILAVGGGGFIGAVGRYLISVFSHRQMGSAEFPYGTAIANILGCFLIGFLAGLFQKYDWGHTELRLFVFVGILGGFTTFSTFTHESFLLWEIGKSMSAFLNIFIQMAGGLLFVWLGYQSMRLF